MSLLKKGFFISLIIIPLLIGILLLFFIFLPGVLGIFYKDIPVTDDRDLRLNKVNLNNENNSYFNLIKIDGNSEIGEEEVKRMEDISGDKDWDSKFVESLISKNEETLGELNKAFNKPHFQDPNFSDPEKITINSIVTSLNAPDILKLIRLDSIKAINYSKKGNDKRAFDEAFNIVALGHKVQNSQGSLISYLIGASIKKVGLETVQKLLSISALDNKSLGIYLEKLYAYDDNETGLINSVKVEYLVQASSVDYVTKTGDVQDLYQSQELDDIGGNLRINSFYFQPNKTKKLFAEYARSIIKDIDKPCGLVDKKEFKRLSPTNPLGLFFNENAIGEILHDIVVIELGSIHNRRCYSDFITSGTQVLVSIRMYKSDNFDYPTDLNKLTTEYLKAAPKDPFDGRAIRYTPSKKIIYSVGEDLIDSGGGIGKNWEEMNDPTFVITF